MTLEAAAVTSGLRHVEEIQRIKDNRNSQKQKGPPGWPLGEPSASHCPLTGEKDAYLSWAIPPVKSHFNTG